MVFQPSPWNSAAYFWEDRREELYKALPHDMWIIPKDISTDRKDRLELTAYKGYSHKRLDGAPLSPIPLPPVLISLFFPLRERIPTDPSFDPKEGRKTIGPHLSHRILGVIIDLEESASSNTQTPCRAVIATRITWQTGVPYETNWIWCKITAFSSNLAVTQCTALMLGQTVEGVIGATYGTHLTAQLEA